MNIRIADYLDYLEYNNKDRDFKTEIIKELRGELKTEVLPSQEDPEQGEDYERACMDARDQLAEQRYQSDYAESWNNSI